MTGTFVGVGRMVPVGVGKTGWKGVGVDCAAGWKGVAVGLAFGLAVTNVNGRAEDDPAGVAPQDVLNSVRISKNKKRIVG